MSEASQNTQQQQQQQQQQQKQRQQRQQQNSFLILTSHQLKATSTPLYNNIVI